ncbi:MAG: type II secretion system protein, partial [bacterium]|nr:type II secretion system protein [bacterium]
MNKQKLIHPKFPHLSWEGYNKNLSSVHRIPPFGHKSSLLIRRKGLQGFTLVELIVVITILAILGT